MLYPGADAQPAPGWASEGRIPLSGHAKAPERLSDPSPPAPKGRQGGLSGNLLTIPVPIIGDKPVTVEGEFPISEAAWSQFIAVLNAMKPGLVRNDPEPPDDSEQHD